MNRLLLTLCLVGLVIGLVSGCAAPQAATSLGATPAAQATPPPPAVSETASPPTPSATATQVPSATLESTASPTSTLEPATATAEPTATPTATQEPTALATATSEPAATVVVTEGPTVAAVAPVEGLAHVFPVKATRYEISSSHHDYPAADIACPIGSEFLAVTSGVVDFVSPEDLWPVTGKNADKGGLSVAIIGDDGVRYYGSHLSEIAQGIVPGARVEAGQLLGLTGESGNAKGVYPQLHFGISHPTTPDDWQTRRGEVWPQKYLKAWARGENLTPDISRE